MEIERLKGFFKGFFIFKVRENQLIHVCSYDMEEFVGREKLVIFKKMGRFRSGG